MAYPGYCEFETTQGATLSRQVTWLVAGSAVNLTSYTAKMQVRRAAGADGSALVSLTSGSGLTLGGTAGTIGITVSSAQSSALPSGRLAYDLQVTSPGGEVTFLLAGPFTVAEAVTR